jgi:hypothetical protein
MLENSRSQKNASRLMTVAFEERKGDGMLRKLALRDLLSELHRNLIRDGMYVDGHATIEVHVVFSHSLIGDRGQLTRHGE